jgi:Zn-dependent M28 family amino/carboxypeptidase
MIKYREYKPPDKRKVHHIKPVLIPKSKLLNKSLDNQIQKLVNLASTKKIKSWVAKLSSFPTRHTKSKYINQAALYLKKEFNKIGYSDVTYHRYVAQIDGTQFNLRNVICRKNGNTDKIVIICAHYDSRMEDLKDALSNAPGANDNASGVAAILEISRILYSIKLDHTIIFALFSGEEQGLLGSNQYARYIANNGMKVHGLINLDMIGYPILNPGIVIVERDNNKDPKHNHVKDNDHESIKFGNVMKNASLYTDLQIHLDSMYDSDYEPFEAEGYVVIGAYDGSADHHNPHYHSTSDTTSLIDWDYLTSVTKLVLATIVSVAKKQ